MGEEAGRGPGGVALFGDEDAYRLGDLGGRRYQVTEGAFDEAVGVFRVPGEERWVRRLRRCNRAGIRRAVLGVVDRAPIHRELGRVSAPTLVVVGADDVATPPAKAERIAATIPGACLEVVPGSGHNSTLDNRTP